MTGVQTCALPIYGDGRPEVVIADERGVTVYRWHQSGGLLRLAGAEFRPGGVVLSVDAADLDGTGRAQVVVVDFQGQARRDAIRSTILAFEGGEFRKRYEVGGRYLRVVPVDGEPWLLEQRQGETQPLDPVIRRLVWRDGRYQDGLTLRVPKDVTVYGLALLRLTGRPEPDIVALTPEDRLAVWTAGGQRLWTSPDALGGPVVTFDLERPRPRGEGDTVIGRVLGRVVPLPPGPDGPELLVFENQLPAVGGVRTFLPRLVPALFTSGRIHRLRWKEGGFVPVWQSRSTEGYVADFGYGDVDGDGIPDVVVGVVPRGLTAETLNPFGRGRAHLVFYELP